MVRRILYILLLCLTGVHAAQGQDRLINTGSVWKYDDRGVDLGNVWTMLAFDDSGWDDGPAILGYGESDIQTVVSYGPNSADKHITTYFRKTFVVTGAANYNRVIIDLLRDDGAAVYLNGQLLFISNLPEDFTYNTLALEGVGGEEERTYYSYVSTADYLVEGTNVLAVEIHQQDPASSDLSFDLQLDVSDEMYGDVRINELGPRNVSTYLEPDYKQFQDWIELHNPAPYPVDLSGYGLTDNINEPHKWRFPEGVLIQADGYLVLSADGLNEGLHTSFRLSGDGERVVLFDPDDKLLDSISYPSVAPDESFGILPSGARGYFAAPTPGARNGEGYLTNARASIPTFSAAAGFYASTISLTLSASEPDAEIRYTLDGSLPDLNADVYTGPVSISRNRVVRARVYAPGILPSETVVQSYFIDRNHDLPVFSIATDPDFLYDDEVGIYLDSDLPTRKLWDRPGSIEFFVNEDRAFVKNIDYRLFGRGAIYFPQKSLAVFLRLTNGYDGLNYSLFPDSPVEHFQSFLLRSSSDDWRNTMFRDGMIHSLLVGNMDLEFQDYRPAVLYINGDYFGIHNIRDKLNESYLATHKGVDPEHVDLLFIDNDYLPPSVEVKAGTDQAYWTMYDFITKNDMRIAANFQKAAELIDLNNYQDYCAVQIIAGNRSWLHNRRVWRPKTPDGKFRYMLFDLDYGYQFLEQNILQSLDSKDLVFENLMDNQEFRSGLIQKIALYAQTIFSESRVSQFIDSFSAAIESEIPRHASRWGPTFTNNFKNQDEWEDRVDDMRDFNENRASRHESYIQNYLGNPGRIDFSVSVLPAGTGQVFVHGVRISGDSFSGYLYEDQLIRLRAEATAGNRFAGWSGNNLVAWLADDGEWDVVNGRVMNTEIVLKGDSDVVVQAHFNDPAESPLIITELFYYPDNTQGGDDGEFIELVNTGNQNINLSGFRLSDAMTYSFPDGSQIAAGEVILVAKDPSRYQNLGVDVYDWDDGRLSDTGEDLYLKNGSGEILDQVFFRAASPWPISNRGYSIELCDANTDNNEGASWRLSASYGGTPGVYSGYSCPTLFINELVGQNSGQDYLGTTDWLELVNPGTVSVDLAGLFITDVPNNPFRYQVPEGFPELTTIPAGGYKVFIADGFQDTGPLHTSFKISGGSGYLGVFFQKPDGSFQLIDEVYYDALPRQKSYARIPDARGDFRLTWPTPDRKNVHPPFELVTPAVVQPGEEIPVVIRITDEYGEIDRSVLRSVTLRSSSGSLSPAEFDIRNGMGSANIRFTATSDFEISIDGYPHSRDIAVRTLPKVELSGTISDTRMLTAGITYQMDESVTVSSSGRLILEQGARLQMGRKANLYVDGHLEIHGTLEQPVVIMPQDPDNPWGGFEFEDQSDTVRISYAFFVRGGYDSSRATGHSWSQPVIRAEHATLKLDNSFFFDHIGKGMFTRYSQVFISNSLYSRCDTGPEFEFGLAEVRSTWFIDIPDNDWSTIDDDNDPLYFEGVLAGDDRWNIVDGCVIYMSEDDGIDISGTRLKVSNTWFSRNYEKGISGGWRSELEVSNCLFYRNHTGVSSTFWTPVRVDHCTFYKNTRAVHSIDGGGVVTNSILVDHETDYSDDGENFWQFNYCLSDTDPNLPGTGNLRDDPDFNDTDDLDFSLSFGSPAIDAGDPRFQKDPDGSVTDLGFLPFGNGQTGRKALIISEIHYNPVAPSGISEQYEFIELSYAGYTDLDVSGYRISDAIEFSFPAGVILKPGEIVLLAFEKPSYRHLDCRVFEWSDGKLSNGGEQISLYDTGGSLVDLVVYGDSDPWPVSADGKGFSLELSNLFSDNTLAGNWVAGQVPGGTPGQPYQPVDFSKVRINEMGSHYYDTPYAWLEIHNNNLHALQLKGTRFRTGSGAILVVPGERQWVVPGVSGYLTLVINPSELAGWVSFTLSPGEKLFFERFDGQQWLLIDQVDIPDIPAESSYGRYPDGTGTFRLLERATPNRPNTLASSRIIAARTFSTGELLPVVVKMTDMEEPLYMINTDLQVSSSIDLSERSLSLVNGQGGLVAEVDEEDSFILSFDQADDTLGVVHVPSRHRFHVDKNIKFDQTWTADHAYYIDNNLEIPSGVTLTIREGTRVYLAENNKIVVYGKLVIDGHPQDPVIFTSWDPDEPWGNIEFPQYSGGGQLSGVFFINGGGDSGDITGYTDSQAILESVESDLDLNHCYFIDNPGKALYAYGGQIAISHSLVSESETGFIVQEGALVMDQTWMQFIPDKQAMYDEQEHDGAFISGETGHAYISHSSFGRIADDGLTIISGATAVVRDSYFMQTGDKAITINEASAEMAFLLITSSDEGISVRGSGTSTADHLTMDNNGIQLKSFASSDGTGGDLRVNNSILVNHDRAAFYQDDQSDLSIRYTLSNKELFDGTGNLQADPGFVDIARGDYRLSFGSPAVDAGDPESPPDNDGSRTDMGAFTGKELSENTGILINEIMYAPLASAGFAEFIELYHAGTAAIQLDGYAFVSGVGFTFPAGVTMNPGEYLVLTNQYGVYAGKGYQVFQWTNGDLSDTGESISLVDQDGKVVNTVTYARGNGWPERSAFTGLSLELKDPGLSNGLGANWQSSYVTGGTPGKQNSRPGTEGLVINELMARNLSVIQDETGSYPDWVEIYNTSEQVVTMRGLYLSKDPDNLTQWQLTGSEEELLLEPGAYQLIWLDAQPEKGRLHANFELAGAGDFLALSRISGGSAEIVSSVTYTNLGGDLSYGRYPNGTGDFTQLYIPTPGGNNDVGAAPLLGLKINELLARNQGVYLNDLGEYDDWIELYNHTGAPIDIAGLYFSDDTSDPLKSRIPFGYSAETTVPPFGFLMVFPSAKPGSGPRHLDFQLAGAGEDVVITQILQSGEYTVDQVTYPVLGADLSYGRSYDGYDQWQVFTIPTPNASNGYNSTEEVWFNAWCRAWPNPVTDWLTLDLTYPEVFDYSVEVFSVLSSETRVLDRGERMAAFHTVTRSYPVREIAGAGTGMVFLRIRINEETFVRKLVIFNPQ